jgi:hypothetical protein
LLISSFSRQQIFRGNSARLIQTFPKGYAFPSSTRTPSFLKPPKQPEFRTFRNFLNWINLSTPYFVVGAHSCCENCGHHSVQDELAKQGYNPADKSAYLFYQIKEGRQVGDFHVSLTYGAFNQEEDTNSDNNMFMKEKEYSHEKMIEDLSLLGVLNNIPLSWNNASNTIKSHENVINSYHNNNNNSSNNKNNNSKQKQPI